VQKSVHTNVPKDGKQTKRGSFLLLALHLIPGIVFALVFFLLAKALMGIGATAYLGLIISIPICLVPIELGIMTVWSRKTKGTSLFGAALGYRVRGELIDGILILILLLLIILVAYFLTGPLSLQLESYFSTWVPEWLTTEDIVHDLSTVSSAQRWITFILAFVLSGFVAPIVEEMYFRGFLLAKMGSIGVVAPIVNAFLFAIYHFYLPWNVLGIFVCFIPIAYAVRARKNFLISTVIHSVSNILGVLNLVWLTRAQ
jgi:membrane protease YdiL (CAAX protease family)